MNTKSNSTSNDIATAAGVSQATVSRVLRGAANVTPATRTKVLNAAKALNYQPNALARAMRTNRIGVVGVVVARMNNPLYTDIVRGLNSALSRAGQRVVVWDTEGGGEVAAIDAIRQSLVDGVIFAAATQDSQVLNEAVAAGAPLALINRTIDALSCDQVSSDNIAGGRRVAEYFLQHRRRRIGFVTGGHEASTIRDREFGFTEALAEAGQPVETSLTRRVPFLHQSGREAMLSLLDLADPPDAVFCANDLLAFGALDATVDRGLLQAERPWIVGFDDVEMASWSSLSLTTVRQNTPAIIEDGVALLLDRLRSRDTIPRQIVHPVDLMIRGSTGRAPVRRVPPDESLAD